jgi:hypothetical protein
MLDNREKRKQDYTACRSIVRAMESPLGGAMVVYAGFLFDYIQLFQYLLSTSFSEAQL